MVLPLAQDTPLPNAVDAAVGINVRSWRLKRRMSLVALGDAIGVTYQQIRAYERGRGSITCSALFRIAKALDCSVDELFQMTSSASIQGDATSARQHSIENLKLAHAISRLPHAGVRSSLLSLVATLVKTGNLFSADMEAGPGWDRPKIG